MIICFLANRMCTVVGQPAIVRAPGRTDKHRRTACIDAAQTH